MIDDEKHPEYIKVRKALFEQIATLAQRLPFAQRTIEIMQELCDDCTKKARSRGIRFPEMVVTYFLHSRVIKVWDRSADHFRIQGYIKDTIREFPKMTAGEIADGLQRAYPHYKAEREQVAYLEERVKHGATLEDLEENEGHA